MARPMNLPSNASTSAGGVGNVIPNEIDLQVGVHVKNVGEWDATQSYTIDDLVCVSTTKQRYRCGVVKSTVGKRPDGACGSEWSVLAWKYDSKVAESTPWWVQRALDITKTSPMISATFVLTDTKSSSSTEPVNSTFTASAATAAAASTITTPTPSSSVAPIPEWTVYRTQHAIVYLVLNPSDTERRQCSALMTVLIRQLPFCPKSKPSSTTKQFGIATDTEFGRRVLDYCASLQMMSTKCPTQLNPDMCTPSWHQLARSLAIGTLQAVKLMEIVRACRVDHHDLLTGEYLGTAVLPSQPIQIDDRPTNTWVVPSNPWVWHWISKVPIRSSDPLVLDRTSFRRPPLPTLPIANRTTLDHWISDVHQRGWTPWLDAASIDLSPIASSTTTMMDEKRMDEKRPSPPSSTTAASRTSTVVVASSSPSPSTTTAATTSTTDATMTATSPSSSAATPPVLGPSAIHTPIIMRSKRILEWYRMMHTTLSNLSCKTAPHTPAAATTGFLSINSATGETLDSIIRLYWIWNMSSLAFVRHYSSAIRPWTMKVNDLPFPPPHIRPFWNLVQRHLIQSHLRFDVGLPIPPSAASPSSSSSSAAGVSSGSTASVATISAPSSSASEDAEVMEILLKRDSQLSKILGKLAGLELEPNRL